MQERCGGVAALQMSYRVALQRPLEERGRRSRMNAPPKLDEHRLFRRMGMNERGDLTTEVVLRPKDLGHVSSPG